MLMGVSEFERLFRQAASLDVDKNDLKRLSDFLGKKIRDVLVVAERNAKYNGRDVIFLPDLPVTKGLQETINHFEQLDTTLGLTPILEHLATLPPLDLAVSEEVEQFLPSLTGGFCVALAMTFKVLDPELKNPQTEHWERAERIFDLLA